MDATNIKLDGSKIKLIAFDLDGTLSQHKTPISDECRACGVCTQLGCPAISTDKETGKAIIDQTLCVGCNQCAQACPFGCIG